MWIGFSLACLFFYPLAAVLEDDRYYLHWRPDHGFELALAIFVLTLVFGCGWAAAERLGGRLGALFLVSLVGVPFASCVTYVVRQLSQGGALSQGSLDPAIRVSYAACALFIISIAIVWPNGLRTFLRGLILAIFPVVLLLVKTFALSSFDSQGLEASRNKPVVMAARTEDIVSTSRCAPVLVFLFDELSFSYLYDGRDIRGDLPHFRRLLDTSTNYLSAWAPGRDTMVSLPGYLAARRLNDVRITGQQVLEVSGDGSLTPFDARAPNSLFARAKDFGLRTEMAGCYFQYCDLLGELLDDCRSFSFYNASTLDSGFSILSPFVTTLQFWPRNMPFSLITAPIAVQQQRRLIEETFKFAQGNVDLQHPAFRFVHFFVPHRPFIFDVQGVRVPPDPYSSSDINYRNQLQYVDTLVGRLIDHFKAAGVFDHSTFVVMSDHGFRGARHERDAMHVPFIAKMPGQRARRDHDRPVAAEQLLPELLEAACRSPREGVRPK